jgi:hypothetical protein
MRRTDENPPDPQMTASLAAIDATLDGEAVDPEFAELAELALLLAADRPLPPPPFLASLDERVQRRFAPTSARRRRLGAGRFRPRWAFVPALGLVGALLVAIGVVFVGGSRPNDASSSAGASVAATRPAPAPRGSAPFGGRPSSSAAAALPGSQSSSEAAGSPAAVLQPPPNGRKIIQGSQLSLTAPPTRIDAVAEEIFLVVGQADGIVNSSTVTAAVGPGAYAQFQLSIPSQALPQTMAALSSLRYARVLSRTDTTQDVNNQYQDDVRRLADDRALRTSLLKQLANASTQAQIDSLNAQIHDADAAISSDESTLSALNAQINYSRVIVTINGGIQPVVANGDSGGGFGLGRAAHDAGRVLSVAAGVALIALAGLVPFSLLAGIAWWVAAAIRRRRREQALDLV